MKHIMVITGVTDVPFTVRDGLVIAGIVLVFTVVLVFLWKQI